MKVKAIQTGNLSFEIDQSGHKYTVDTKKEFGGDDKGPSPKALLLGGLLGCSGMDVASVLKKMHIEYEELSMTADAEQTEEHPKIYKDIMMEYFIKGSDDLDITKIKRAVELSMTKYCGVAAMLRKNSTIRYKIFLNDRLIHE
ncbi:MAG: OsmC family protein [Candidatus Delongbacteria bacterium]|nr:OsmC family protein [Candidatus Delongbacteria bacterium]MCG2761329.1 OsmC family protein [Candidatus Delongbacteria bacterium]